MKEWEKEILEGIMLSENFNRNRWDLIKTSLDWSLKEQLMFLIYLELKEIKSKLGKKK